MPRGVEASQSSTDTANEHTVCMIGAGYVGALTAIALATKNPRRQFCVVDKDKSLIDSWESECPPIFEPGLEDLLFPDGLDTAALSGKNDLGQNPAFDPRLNIQPSRRKNRLSNISFSAEVCKHVKEAGTIFICVDTPLDVTTLTSDNNNGLDLKNLKAVVETIAHVSVGHKIIVQKSTGPCGVVQWIRETLRETASSLASFDVLSSPEFLAQGTAIQDLLYPNRIVLGHINDPDTTPAALATIRQLYTPWVPGDRIITTDTWSSELAKIASNAFIAQRISSINSLSAVCEAANADVSDLSRIVGLDPRIGPLCLRAGFGFGGSCLHKDLCCLVYLARELGLHDVAAYWRGVIQINESQVERIACRIEGAISPFIRDEGTRVAILGFSFKKNTADIRNTTALGLVRELVRRGLQVSVYDAHVMTERIKKALNLQYGSDLSELRRVNVVNSVKAACWRCCVVVLHTDWDEFSSENVGWRDIVNQMDQPRAFLGPGGTFDQQAMQSFGFRVLTVGKADSLDSPVSTVIL
ncbi:hypothetical protein FE257_001285 [Aspergillus nanangensis]|uniref:UDP-glucose 6-dehydrogenase n=1 Tax=Aspergillus nanangensis TaxID=2582783 RepID=A0AAD4CDY7_ASPNN|nr:hypothetical protein FE257_001285 [Aspergillus nanangensis]